MNTPAGRLRNFGFLIKDIGRLYTKLFENEAAPLGISLADAKVLSALSRNAELTQVQLAELSGVEPMSLVRILDRMEAGRWIERRPHPTDRRARHIYLKDQAQSTLDEIWKVAGQIRARALAEFGAAERNVLVEQLGRIHTKMSGMVVAQEGSALQKTALPGKKSIERRIGGVAAHAVRSRVQKSRRVVR